MVANIVYIRFRYSKCLYDPRTTCLGNTCNANCQLKLVDYRAIIRPDKKAEKASEAKRQERG